MLKVLLVDDQRLFVEMLKDLLLLRSRDFEVVGIAHDGGEAVPLVRDLKPDIVLMDVRMPGMDGVEAVKLIMADDPSVKILMLTTFDDDEYVYQAMNSGAAGYVLKDINPEELIESIKMIASGASIVPSKIVRKIFDRSPPPSRETGDRGWDELLDRVWPQLSRREKEIFHLLGGGSDNKEIAARLYIAEQTVKNSISVLYGKFGIHDRSKLSALSSRRRSDP